MRGAFANKQLRTIMSTRRRVWTFNSTVAMASSASFFGISYSNSCRVSRLEPVGTCRKMSKTCADLRVDRAPLSAGVGAGCCWLIQGPSYLGVGAGHDAKLKCVDAAFLCAFYPRSGPYICRRLSVYLHPFNVLCTISRHWHGSCSYAGACSAQTVVSSGQRCLRRSQPLNGEALSAKSKATAVKRGIPIFIEVLNTKFSSFQR